MTHPFANPMVVRYARSRLRWKKAVFWYALTFVICAFMTAITVAVETQRRGVTLSEAARDLVLPLIIVQGVILLFLGTGAVATGITRDKIEDVLDYQRMTPMPPIVNLMGYILGLPVREYILFAITVPFTLFALIVGGIPVLAWLTFYLIFFLSALLYHATGLTAGLVSKRWRWSGRLTQGLVLVLYFILPQFSHLGFVSFEFLTVRPVLADTLFPLLYPLAKGDLVALSALAGQEVPFFNLNLSATLFSILLQGSLLFLLLTMAKRKWVHLDAPSMSKPVAVSVFAATLILALGNLWPNLTGKPLSLGAFTADAAQTNSDFLFIAFPLVFSLLLLVLGIFLIHIISTNPDRYRRGCVRAKRWGWKRIPYYRDEGSAWWCVVLFIVMAVGTLLLTFQLTAAHYPLEEGSFIDLNQRYFLPVGVALLFAQFMAIRDWLGEERIFLYQLLCWFVPILMAGVLGAASDALTDVALWLAGLSPFALIPYSVLSMIESRILGKGTLNFGAARNFTFIFQTLLTIGLCFYLQQRLKKIRNDV